VRVADLYHDAAPRLDLHQDGALLADGDRADHDALHLQHARADREFQPCNRRRALDFVRRARF
jgi:hypothetical protein